MKSLRDSWPFHKKVDGKVVKGVQIGYKFPLVTERDVARLLQGYYRANGFRDNVDEDKF